MKKAIGNDTHRKNDSKATILSRLLVDGRSAVQPYCTLNAASRTWMSMAMAQHCWSGDAASHFLEKVQRL